MDPPRSASRLYLRGKSTSVTRDTSLGPPYETHRCLTSTPFKRLDAFEVTRIPKAIFTSLGAD
ncbi:hypothetical protein E2C01_060164 [Portunus trituberculatus]|uniref:Uncharacterized protein n=1 Tax=Portunus trituberculatus TaxID=210409 RepID=A0A5B7H090_PORTR|nr:hypothetical protein [Portunus trituberculatus]